jgi:hypothetical protein
MVEVYNDVSRALPDSRRSLNMIAEVKGAKLLRGFRVSPGDVDALADARAGLRIWFCTRGPSGGTRINP